MPSFYFGSTCHPLFAPFRIVSISHLLSSILISILWLTTWFLQPACFFDRRVFVGDVVVLKDPQKSDDYLVRRLAAIEGYEMVSKDEKDEPFILEKDQCWVVADNENIMPKVNITFLSNNLIISFSQIVWFV